MSKRNKLESLRFMPDIEQASVNNRNLKEMFSWGDQEYAFIPIASIAFNPDNDYAAKDNAESIQILAEDILRNGLLHNIVVSQLSSGQYKLLSGERRVRAYQQLWETTHQESYQSIYALIKKDLTPRQELIIMDAANLQTRGTEREEKRFRKAGMRFIQNLKMEFSISEQEAVQLTKEYLPTQEKTIDRNLNLEKNLDPKLLALLDTGILSKNEAIHFLPLETSLQQISAQAIASALTKEEQQKRIAELLSLINKRKALKQELARQTRASRILSTDVDGQECPRSQQTEEILQRTRQALYQNECLFSSFSKEKENLSGNGAEDFSSGKKMKDFQQKLDRISDLVSDLMRFLNQNPDILLPPETTYSSQLQKICENLDQLHSHLSCKRKEKK